MTALREAVEVWLAESTASHPPRLLDLLSPAEETRAERIRHAGARAQFVTGRLLLRQVLSRRAPIEPHAWRIEATHSGRPEIAGPSHSPDLRFNLSHSGHLVSCVVSTSLTCGIDVEAIDRPVDVLGIARHSFDAAEIRALETLAMPAREELFFALWTLKEAYVKARGRGIRLRLDSARFEITPSGLITTSMADDRQQARWSFLLFEPAPRYRLAVAFEQARPPSDLTFRTLDQNGDARTLEVPLIASSRR